MSFKSSYLTGQTLALIWRNTMHIPHYGRKPSPHHGQDNHFSDDVRSAKNKAQDFVNVRRRNKVRTAFQRLLVTTYFGYAFVSSFEVTQKLGYKIFDTINVDRERKILGLTFGTGQTSSKDNISVH